MYDNSKDKKHLQLFLKIIDEIVCWKKSGITLSYSEMEELKSFISNNLEYNNSIDYKLAKALFKVSNYIPLLIVILIKKGVEILINLGLECFKRFLFASLKDFCRELGELKELKKHLKKIMNEYYWMQTEFISNKLNCLLSLLKFNEAFKLKSHVIIYISSKQVMNSLVDFLQSYKRAFPMICLYSPKLVI